MYDRLNWTPIALERNRILRQHEPLQPHVMFLLCERFRPAIFLDVGANIGTYALFATHFPEIETILAFEAAPRTYQELCANISLNSLEHRVEPFNGALSDKEGGAVDFMIVNDFSGANGIADTSIHKVEGMSTLRVPSHRLDATPSIRGCAGKRIAMKLDVEGHELPVLEGASAILEANEILLQVECYSADTDYERPEDTRLGKALSAKGFRYLFHLGADQYWTSGSFALTEQELRKVLEQGIEQMIHFSRTLGSGAEQDTTRIRRQLLPGLSIEVSGRLANWLRRTLRR